MSQAESDHFSEDEILGDVNRQLTNLGLRQITLEELKKFDEDINNKGLYPFSIFKISQRGWLMSKDKFVNDIKPKLGGSRKKSRRKKSRRKKSRR